MVYVKRFSFLFFLLLLGSYSYATHNRAGEITYEQIDDLTIRVTVTTYTKTSSTAADRDSLEVFWGDGTSQFVSRSNGNGDPLPNDVKLNKYISTHTYPGRGTYTIYFLDPNRVDNILNVNPPYSIEIPFFLSTTFTFLDPQFQGFNSSAVLLQPPLDVGCVGVPFIHNPNAFDADGDSIAYEMIAPFQDVDLPVPNYIPLDQIGAGENNTISLDPLTGTFTWDSPTIPGEYNIAFLVKEYRQGVLINSMVRDMQILIRDCINNPPSIESVDEVCIVAGEVMELDILIDDPDPNQQVFVEATGGPFEVENPAILEAPDEYQPGPINATLKWNTDCNHIFNDYYQVVIRAVDNYFADSTGLATLKTIRIKVLGPRPEGIEAESRAGGVDLSWELPYVCENARDGYFQGFSVWRKSRTTELPADTCANGLAGLGYEKIQFLTNENDGIKYTFRDTDVQANEVYCYRILAEFALFTKTGNPFNRVESIASEEICLIVKRDLPFLTEANVITTDNNDGVVRVSWTKPVARDLDTIANPGPYRYQLEYQTNGDWIPVPGADFSIANFSDPVDTSITHSQINTEINQFRYRVNFYTGNGLFGTSKEATTIFLNTEGSDNIINLSWQEETPWVNTEYIILKEQDNGSFIQVASTTENTYVDTDNNNGEETCYIIQSIGGYGVINIKEPIINNSQKSCTVPVDNVAPCPPLFSIENDCDQIGETPSVDELGNTLRWNVDENCSTLDDISEFRIYYAISDSEYVLIHTASSSRINEFFHQPESGLAGCYSVTAVDGLGNESSIINEICVENCPKYVLPNTFTPNQDGANDIFIPRVNRFISRVEFEVYNQWGNKVYESTNPRLEWDGTNMSGNELQEGVYYYICNVYEVQANGENSLLERLKGHINLLR